MVLSGQFRGRRHEWPHGASCLVNGNLRLGCLIGLPYDKEPFSGLMPDESFVLEDGHGPVHRAARHPEGLLEAELGRHRAPHGYLACRYPVPEQDGELPVDRLGTVRVDSGFRVHDHRTVGTRGCDAVTRINRSCQVLTAGTSG